MNSFKKIIFISNWTQGYGMSGGDRIWIELAKSWRVKADITIICSEEAKIISKRYGLEKVNFKIIVKKIKNKNNLSVIKLILNLVKRTIYGVFNLLKLRLDFKKVEFIYSVSDFWPDFFPAFFLKILCRNSKWIVGYYLFSPNPFSKESPYKGKNRIRGLFYWIMQLPTFFIAKYWADFIFVTSEPDIKKFITKKRNKEKIVVIQGGVDVTESEKYLKSGEIIPIEKRKYDACFVGRFHFQKGVLELIDIWKKVVEKRRDAKLAIIGNGTLENEMIDKIKRNRLESNIDMLGFMDGNAKYEIFKQSKIMVHPATYDSGGMAAAEGMAWGLPGVSFDLEALKTYYPKGMIKAEKNNFEAFTENILKLLTDINLYNKTAKDAHDLIVEAWDWKRRSNIIFKKLV